VEPEDLSKIWKVIRDAAYTVTSESRTLPTSRFAALIAFAVFTVVCASGTAYFIFHKPTPVDPAVTARAEADHNQLVELRQQVQEVKLEGARKDSALAAMSERVRDVETSNAQLKDSQQKLQAQVKDGQQKLEAQAQEIPLLKGKVASMEKKAVNLTADFMKLVLAAGATTSTTAFAALPNRPKLPPDIEKQIAKVSPDLAKETTKPSCLFWLKNYGLFCDFDQQ
jgi:hypothetical protein